LRKLTVGSLFAGIGGIELGLERTGGFRTIWQVENDDYCTKVLEKRWPEVQRFGDVREIGKEMADTDSGRLEGTSSERKGADDAIGDSGKGGKNIPYADLVCGGFPCQPVSHAGKRKGTEDARWLWPEFIRIVRMVRPRYVLVENVPGLLSANDGAAMSEILGDLAESGYDAQWNRVGACTVGAPHRRERVFIVAYPHRDSPPQDRGEVRRAPRALRRHGARRLADRRGDVLADTEIKGLERQRKHKELEEHRQLRVFAEGDFEALGRGKWPAEPNVGRVAHGVPSRVDRLKCLGNAVVPQVAEAVGYMILEFDRKWTRQR
jgi:DNA (cytosine-5)-methyltransferase 1